MTKANFPFPHSLLHLTSNSCWCVILWLCGVMQKVHMGLDLTTLSAFLDFHLRMCIFVPFSESEMTTCTVVFFLNLFILSFLPSIFCYCSSNYGSNKGSSLTCIQYVCAEVFFWNNRIYHSLFPLAVPIDLFYFRHLKTLSYLFSSHMSVVMVSVAILCWWVIFNLFFCLFVFL